MIFILSLAIIFLGSRWTIVIAILTCAVGITFLLWYRQRYNKRQ
jgi:c-di-AMP phosphodiesterase-like protein